MAYGVLEDIQYRVFCLLAFPCGQAGEAERHPLGALGPGRLITDDMGIKSIHNT